MPERVAGEAGDMGSTRQVLVLGASYGSLFATKLLLAGHAVTLVCTRPTADLINAQGTLVRLPVREREDPVEISSKRLPGRLTARAPGQVQPEGFDLVVLAMQEPQYAAAGVRELLDRVGGSRIPCMAIMNMPPPPFLERIPGISAGEVASCYTHPALWQGFDPGLVTVASPDPQAFRPPEEGKNVLQVSLPTNFKVARFESEEHTQMLRRMEADIEAVRFEAPEGALELPVKLRVHESVFVPLAKWAMLLAGNYRCIREDGMIPIRDAVHSDLEASREIYDWVGDLCKRLGAAGSDLVPFEKYASAASGLRKPSSAARALLGGALNIERVDCLVKGIARQLGLRSHAVDEIVALVDRHLGRNRAAHQVS